MARSMLCSLDKDRGKKRRSRPELRRSFETVVREAQP